MNEQTADNVVGTRPSLAGKFKATPDRGAAVAGLLAPRPTPVIAEPIAESNSPVPVAVEPVPVPVAVEPVPVAVPVGPRPEATAAVRASATVRKRAASKSSAKPARVSTVKQVSAYLEPDVSELVVAAVRTGDLTYDALLVRSFEEVADDALRALWVPTVSATAMPTREVRQRGTAGIQRQFQLSDTQTEWLDRKIETVGAPSRSALIAAVLALALRKP